MDVVIPSPAPSAPASAPTSDPRPAVPNQKAAEEHPTTEVDMTEARKRMMDTLPPPALPLREKGPGTLGRCFTCSGRGALLPGGYAACSICHGDGQVWRPLGGEPPAQAP